MPRSAPGRQFEQRNSDCRPDTGHFVISIGRPGPWKLDAILPHRPKGVERSHQIDRAVSRTPSPTCSDSWNHGQCSRSPGRDAVQGGSGWGGVSGFCGSSQSGLCSVFNGSLREISIDIGVSPSRCNESRRSGSKRFDVVAWSPTTAAVAFQVGFFGMPGIFGTFGLISQLRPVR